MVGDEPHRIVRRLLAGLQVFEIQVFVVGEGCSDERGFAALARAGDGYDGEPSGELCGIVGKQSGNHLPYPFGALGAGTVIADPILP